MDLKALRLPQTEEHLFGSTCDLLNAVHEHVSDDRNLGMVASRQLNSPLLLPTTVPSIDMYKDFSEFE